MKILFIVGSLRKGSFNHMLADLAMKALEKHPGAEVRWLDYGDLPVFNADNTYPFGEAANAVREAIGEMDALWIFCPEYNGSIPGPLKNVLDYASLPWKKDNLSSGTPLMGKPVAVSGAGGKFATSRSRAELVPLLGRCGCKVMTEPQVGVALPASSFKDGLWTPSQDDIDAIGKEADAFVEFVRKTLDIHR